jgi:hypothetical protein
MGKKESSPLGKMSGTTSAFWMHTFKQYGDEEHSPDDAIVWYVKDYERGDLWENIR